jgi:hypothetical protein
VSDVTRPPNWASITHSMMRWHSSSRRKSGISAEKEAWATQTMARQACTQTENGRIHGHGTHVVHAAGIVKHWGEESGFVRHRIKDDGETKKKKIIKKITSWAHTQIAHVAQCYRVPALQLVGCARDLSLGGGGRGVGGRCRRHRRRNHGKVEHTQQDARRKGHQRREQRRRACRRRRRLGYGLGPGFLRCDNHRLTCRNRRLR